MISIDHLSVEFSAKPLFSDISYVINDHDRIALVGKNGAGKSTMLKIIAGIQQATEGTVSAPRDTTIAYLEAERQKFIADKENRQPWHNMIQMLPSSYNQMRTVTLNYENLINIYYARKSHKLAEWHVLCDWILSLPYAPELICIKEQG